MVVSRGGGGSEGGIGFDQTLIVRFSCSLGFAGLGVGGIRVWVGLVRHYDTGFSVDWGFGVWGRGRLRGRGRDKVGQTLLCRF